MEHFGVCFRSGFGPFIDCVADLTAHYAIVIGLPGSGKSYLLSQYRQQGYRIIDDVLQQDNFESLLQPQGQTDKIAVADPFFCRAQDLVEFMKLLPADATHETIYFENNPKAALKNRNQESRLTENLVRRLSAQYSPINPVKIWCANE